MRHAPGQVDKKRAVFVFLDKLNRRIAENVRQILAAEVGGFPAWTIQPDPVIKEVSLVAIFR